MKNKYKYRCTSCCNHALSHNLKNILYQNLVLVSNCDVFRQHHEQQLTSIHDVYSQFFQWQGVPRA